MESYGQYLPASQRAAEVFAERWTPLILRGAVGGGRHRRFNDLPPRRAEDCRASRCSGNRPEKSWEVCGRPGAAPEEYRHSL